MSIRYVFKNFFFYLMDPKPLEDNEYKYIYKN